MVSRWEMDRLLLGESGKIRPEGTMWEANFEEIKEKLLK